MGATTVYNNLKDTNLLFTGSAVAVGAGTSIDTMGYASIVAQFSGVWAGQIHCEISNDDINWERILFYSSDEVSMQDIVDQNGIYNITTSAKYVRPYISAITGTLGITIIGRVSASARAIDMLSLAMDKNNNTPLNVSLPVNLKTEADGGLILADMKGPIVWNSTTAALTPLIIDCTGYQSVYVHKITTGVVTPSISNDNLNYASCLATAVATTTPAATILTAAGMYIVPVTGKFLKLTGPAAAVTCYIYLSNQPHVVNSSLNNVPYNMAQVAGTATVTAGVAGMIAVGGNIASGTAPTAAPVQVGGVDSLPTPLTRRILTDTLGRQQVGNLPSGRTKGLNILGFDPEYRNPLEVTETGRGSDGASEIDLLEMILKELQILNHQMFELPRLIDEGRVAIDEPEKFREEKFN